MVERRVRTAARMFMVTALVALLAALSFGTVAAKPGGSGPGNSPNAKACQKGGWMDLQRSDGSPFADEKACTSYAANGGTLEPRDTGPTDTFASVCADLGWTYQSGPGREECSKSSPTVAEVGEAVAALEPHCPAPATFDHEGFGFAYFIYCDR